MTAAALLTRVREAGAEFRIVDGQLRLRRASRVPTALIDEIRATKTEIAALVQSPTPKRRAPAQQKFHSSVDWRRHDAAFNALLLRYGVSYDTQRGAAR
jgi:hypothetical protein